MHEFFQSNLFKGALSGFISAIAVDIIAFRAMKDGSEFIHYRWGVAIFRWFQGFLLGGITGAGYGAMIS